MIQPLHRIPVVLALASCLLLPALGFGQAKENNRKEDSRATFVHRIGLNDERGLAIDPNKADAGPYSPMQTCSTCHPVSQMSKGWHFNSNDPSVPAGRVGEPWVYFDATTRSVLPLSYRNWPGTFRPQQAGLSEWDMTLRFARHHTGGGFGAPDTPPPPPPSTRPTTQPTTQPGVDPKARWQHAGKLEIDCMICHSGRNEHDISTERFVQAVTFQNHKWAPTVALGLAHVTGSSANVGKVDEDTGEPFPPPKMTWDKHRFDASKKVLLDVVRRPPSERCYFCHTTNSIDPARGENFFTAHHADGDVHIVNGMNCSDCHRHGTDHMVTRGYPNEAKDYGKPELGALTCAGCHLGDPNSPDPANRLGGKLGSPIPAHEGFPPVHFEKLACTACHSGPWPEKTPDELQTSMAHALGLDLPTRRADTTPRIVGPVFLKGEDGKIAPHKMMWPNYWGRLQKDGSVTLVPPAEVTKAVAGKNILKTLRETQADAAVPLTDEQISQTLVLVGAVPNSQGEPVYISGGKLYRRNADGTVKPENHAAAKAYAWPMGHDVRPAGRSLGSRGCNDCHASDAPMYFASVTPLGPFDPKKAESTLMYQYRDTGYAQISAFNGSFRLRTMLKVIGFACAAVIAAVLLTAVVRAITATTNRSITTNRSM